MRIGSLCTGYGGLDMAVQSVIGGDLAWVADILPASCTVLAAHHPDVPNLGDFTVTDWSTVEPVDLLTAGYPCQPFSTAGKRKGTDDERHLWPFVLTAIRALRPRLVVLENVRGHLSLGFDAVLADLAAVGMSARWGVVRASDAGAPHGRARLFIVATPDGDDAGRGEHGWSVATSAAHLAAEHRGADADDAADAGSDGHGELVHAGGVGGVEGSATGEARQRERARGLPVAGGLVDAPDAEGRRRGTRAGRGSSATGRAESGTGDCGGDAADAASDARRFLDGDGGVAAADATGVGGSTQRPGGDDARRADGLGRGREQPVDWGKYGPAIHRWERVLGRDAPTPALPRATGRDRLNPVFVEWMMGLPAGHVTGHGLSHGAELTLLGNGVVPQQAALALRHLLPARALAPTP